MKNKIRVTILIIGMIAVLNLIFICQSNETKTTNWIDNAKKPITCRENRFSNNDWSYTLTDSNGEIYYTGRVYLVLPNTIKF